MVYPGESRVLSLVLQGPQGRDVRGSRPDLAVWSVNTTLVASQAFRGTGCPARAAKAARGAKVPRGTKCPV